MTKRRKTAERMRDEMQASGEISGVARVDLGDRSRICLQGWKGR